MIKFSQLQKITLTTTLVTISSLVLTPAVSALTLYGVRGTFVDDGTIGGSFKYDAGTDTYTNINITTTPGDSLSGATYNDTQLSSPSSIGFVINGDTPDFQLDLLFESLESEPPSVELGSFTKEYNFVGEKTETRDISSGTVYAVPFEFTPSLGLLLLLTIFGIQRGWKYWCKG